MGKQYVILIIHSTDKSNSYFVSCDSYTMRTSIY